MSDPFLGNCMICHEAPKEVRHINLYIIGSEGLYACHECEMKIVLFIRELSTSYGKSKMAAKIASKLEKGKQNETTSL